MTVCQASLQSLQSRRHLQCALPTFQQELCRPGLTLNPSLPIHLQQLFLSTKVDDHIFSSESAQNKFYFTIICFHEKKIQLEYAKKHMILHYNLLSGKEEGYSKQMPRRRYTPVSKTIKAQVCSCQRHAQAHRGAGFSPCLNPSEAT